MVIFTYNLKTKDYEKIINCNFKILSIVKRLFGNHDNLCDRLCVRSDRYRELSRDGKLRVLGIQLFLKLITGGPKARLYFLYQIGLETQPLLINKYVPNTIKKIN